MGRQVNFYYSHEDEEAFLKIEHLNVVAFLRANVDHARNEEYNEFHLSPHTHASHSQTYICIKSDMKDVRYRKVEKHGFYYLDSIRSPVIEFSRSGLNERVGVLVAGRIWFELKYWDKDKKGNSVLLTKNKELENLYERLARWIKKYCKRLPNGKYIGPHAMKLHEQGAKLS